MRHSSLNSDILWYIDNIIPVPNSSNYRVIGWILSKTSEVINLTLKDNIMSYKIINRPDVKIAYPFISTNSVGIEFIVTSQDIKSPIGVILKGNITIPNIGNIHAQFVAKSGFNIPSTNLVVVDNFYKEPDAIRDYAINNLTYSTSGYHKGKRSSERFILDGTKEIFERILGQRIYNLEHPEYASGVFQFCTKDDPIVYHVDTQQHAGLVYLSPNAPVSTGTATYKSKITGATKFNKEERDSDLFKQTFKGYGDEINFYDGSSYETVDKVGNVYNRLVLFNASSIHAATEYYGNGINNSRFFHLFFFDLK